MERRKRVSEAGESFCLNWHKDGDFFALLVAS